MPYFERSETDILPIYQIFTFVFFPSCGAKFRSNTTGIVYNNELADFFTNTSYSKYPWPKANSPGAGKRPLSSTCPSIVVDKDGDVVMVAGASGGTRITLSVAWVSNKKQNPNF